MTALTFALACCVFCAGAVLQSITGFGFAMIAAPLVALIAPELVPGPVLVLTLLLTLSYCLRSLAQVSWRDVGLILAGRLPFSLLAAWAMAFLNPAWTGLVFGLFLFGSVLLTRRKLRVETTPARLIAAGAASGFFGTITSVAAPPLAIVYQSQPPEILRATLGVNIIIGTGFSLISLAGFGLIDWPELLWQCLFCLPAVLLGSWIGGRVLRRYKGLEIRTAVMTLAGAASLALAVKSLMQLLA